MRSNKWTLLTACTAALTHAAQGDIIVSSSGGAVTVNELQEVSGLWQIDITVIGPEAGGEVLLSIIAHDNEDGIRYCRILMNEHASGREAWVTTSVQGGLGRVTSLEELTANTSSTGEIRVSTVLVVKTLGGGSGNIGTPGSSRAASSRRTAFQALKPRATSPPMCRF